jgi:hypothetical protein
MRRATAVVCAIFLLVTIAAVVIAPSGSASAAATTATWTYYKDKFAERDYDGTDAAGRFSTDWIEVGEANGPTKGYTSISDHDYCYTYCLQIGGGDLAVGNVGIERSLNLEGALEAKLTYIFATDLFGGSMDQAIALQVSANGGTSFTTLKTYLLNADENMERQDYIDISEWAAPQTVIRFISLDGAPANILLIDDFLVKGKFTDGPPPPVTTTTTTTSTTTTTTTTTTTVPPTTTTTTTTTVPPTTTTTSLPPVDTTSTTTPTDGTSTTTTSTTTTLPPDGSTTTTAPPPVNAELPPPGSDASFRTKEALVVAGVARSEVPGNRRATATGSQPVGFAVSFLTTVETIAGGALPATLLGVLIAVLAVIGLNRGFRPEPG